MSTNAAQSYSRNDGVRYSKENALSKFQFEDLVQCTHELKPTWDLETRLILFVCGRLGLRRGELSHMTAEWIDWRQERIIIPAHMPCQGGRDSEICGTCRQQAEQMAEHNDDMTLEDALETRWQPKTRAAARAVPFGWSPRTSMVLREYFDRFNCWMFSASVISRRIDRVVEHSDRVDECHPHALRATAASFHAGRGIDRFSLAALLGWATLDVAARYIRASADNLDSTLRHAHR